MGIRLSVAIALATALLGGSVLAAAEIKNSDCLECHSDKTLTTTNNGVVISMYMDEALLKQSVHSKTTCAQCHSDLTDKHPDDNLPAKPVACGRCHETQSASYSAGIHATAHLKGTLLGKHAAPECVDCHGTHGVLPPGSPASALYFANLTKTCGQCHEQEAKDVAVSVHGKAIAAGRRDAATCTDCHAEHNVEGRKEVSSLQISQDICSKCHASERLNTRYNLPPDRVKTFFASYHGLAAQYGSTRAANCGSCHGFHKILASADPNSTINKAHLMETCGKCHPGASQKFAEGEVHIDAASADGGSNLGLKINWWVRKTYLVMIFAVIGLMAVHNALILGKKAAARARLKGRTVMRMDPSQRLQHFVLLASFTLLAWTGFALKFPDSFAAQLLGSDENIRRWTHRLAGIVMLLAGVYHIGYVVATREGRRLVKDLFPGPKDVRDVLANIKYLTGRSDQKPRFARFGYAEKMEYWAVVWGTIIMGATGLIIWLKIDITKYLPRWAVDVATTIHYYEAILACLAIVVWHFYHVIFDPDIYPLNRAALDGRVSEEWLEEEHPLDPAAKELSHIPKAERDEEHSHDETKV